MKTLIFLLSFMFVSCVTANTESRDLSAVNTAEDENTKIAFNWKFWENRSKQRKNQNKPLTDCYSECEEDFENPTDPCYSSTHDRRIKLNRCLRRCNRSYSKKEGVKVASIRDQNPFNLLKESQNSFEHLSTEDNNHNNKTPIMLAVDYDCCVKICIDEGGRFSECHRVCEE